MATTKKTTTTSETVETKVSKPEKKTFKPDDLIPCKSVTNGELIMVGAKTGINYKWAGCDYVEKVEYQDLLYVARAHSDFVMKPMFIILDDDFISQNKDVEKLYDTMYSFQEITEILKLPINKMIEVIKSQPTGIRNAIQGAAATGITAGTFDSVKKIKALDELFGTSMLQILVDD